MTDRLSLTNALADANIDRKAAERIATEIFDAIGANVATKADLQELKTELKADLQELKADLLLRMSELEHRMTLRFGSVMVVLTGIIVATIRYLPHG
jgi:hypothetical protein